GIIDGDVIAERREVARHAQRGRPGADHGDALAVARFRRLRQAPGDVIVLVIGGDPLQAADGDRFRLDAPAPAGRLAGAVAGAAEDSRKDVGIPVHHIGVGIASGGYQADIFRHRRVRGAGPLAVDDLVKVVGIADVGRVHSPFGDITRRWATTGALGGNLLYRHSLPLSGNAIWNRRNVANFLT